jgi:hypothetical protein
LKSGNQASRIIEAAQAIGERGEKAKDARQALCEALLDRRDAVRAAVASALEKVDPRLHKPVVALVVDQDHSLRVEALRSLGALGEEGKPALSLVLRYVMDVTIAVSEQSGMGVPIGDLPHGTTFIRTMAAIAPDDKRVVKALVVCLRLGENPSGRVEAARGLARRSLRKEAVTELVWALKTDTSELVRVAAAKALGDLGPDAKDAVKSLEAAKIDPAAQVREAAAAALLKIKDPAGPGRRCPRRPALGTAAKAPLRQKNACRLGSLATFMQALAIRVRTIAIEMDTAASSGAWLASRPDFDCRLHTLSTRIPCQKGRRSGSRDSTEDPTVAAPLPTSPPA